MRPGFGFPMLPPRSRFLGVGGELMGGPRVFVIAVPQELPMFPAPQMWTGPGPMRGMAEDLELEAELVEDRVPMIVQQRMPARNLSNDMRRKDRERISERDVDYEEDAGQPSWRRSRRSRRRRATGRRDAAEADRRPRALLPGPGQWRVLPYGEFQAALAGQLAHPERLAHTHQIPCYIQVYESPRESPAAEVARAVLRSGARAPELLGRTRELVQRLQLGSLPLPADDERLQHWIHIQPASDPTALNQPPAAAAVPLAGPPFAAAMAAAPPTPVKKTKIPERYLKPWEFRYAREEVMYDMNRALGGQGVLTSAARWFRRLSRSRAALDKWQALLQGKTSEEQLWSVRPPEGAFQDPHVRQWVSQLLTLEGYDPASMLIEWEIFWRRKRL